jgi:hypothetical protein
MTHQHFMELSNRWFTPISRRVSQSTTTAMSYATPYATTRTIHTYIHHAPNNPSLLFTHKIPSLKPYIHPSQHHFNTALSHPTSKPKRARTHGAPMSHTNRKLSSHTHHRHYHHYQQHTQPIGTSFHRTRLTSCFPGCLYRQTQCNQAGMVDTFGVLYMATA